MKPSEQVTVAVVGATGAVGQEIIKNLEERRFPVKEVRFLASARSAGKTVHFCGKDHQIQEATPDAFSGVDIAFFSAGGKVSEQLAEEAVRRGTVVIDNTNAFRMNPDVPLIVPEVNREKIKEHQGIIANPNCSTIQMVVALKPLYEHYGIERVIVSTYQAVSGSGQEGIDELEQQTKASLAGEDVPCKLMPVGKLPKRYPISFNALPQCDVGLENGYTLEEMKMVQETKKIFDDEQVEVTATCVRVPVFRGHSESIYVELSRDFDLDEVREDLRRGAGIVVEDDLENQIYPTPLAVTGQHEVFVGRIRRDLAHPRGLNMWVVADNLLKGAATNAVHIAENLIQSKG